MTKLSLVIPVRNVAPYFPALAESLIRNCRTDFEFVIIDDASTDHTPELIAEYRERLPGLVALRNETPVGLADARNQGLAASSGEFLSFADGDDWLLGGYLEQLVSAISGLAVDFVRVDHIRATGKQRRLVRAPTGRRNMRLVPAELIAPASRQTLVDYRAPWAGIYHRRLADRGLLDFPGGLSPTEDRPWTWQLHLEAKSCAVATLAGYFRSQRSPSAWTGADDHNKFHYLTAFNQVLELVADQPMPIREKAVRGLLAAIGNQLESEENVTPVARRQHRHKVFALLESVDSTIVSRSLSQMSSERQKLISRCQKRRRWSLR